MGKARLTRRQQRVYHSILNDTAGIGGIFWPPPRGEWRGPNNGYRNCWGAWCLAKRWHGREGVDLKRLQLIVIQGANAECAYRFAMDVPGANVRRLQHVVISAGDPHWMRVFADDVPGAHVEWLRNSAIVAEALSS